MRKYQTSSLKKLSAKCNQLEAKNDLFLADYATFAQNSNQYKGFHASIYFRCNLLNRNLYFLKLGNKLDTRYGQNLGEIKAYFSPPRENCNLPKYWNDIYNCFWNILKDTSFPLKLLFKLSVYHV